MYYTTSYNLSVYVDLLNTYTKNKSVCTTVLAVTQSPSSLKIDGLCCSLSLYVDLLNTYTKISPYVLHY